MKVVVVAEYYPRRRDPVLGVWAHRQALAARDAGADVSVVVLERPIPPRSALRTPHSALRDIRAQPKRDSLDGIEVQYARFLAPPRGWSYASWGRWARRSLERALRTRSFDLLHAHYAIPAGDAARGFCAERGIPLVTSVHGGDVLGPLLRSERAQERVGEVLRSSAIVLCNSRDTLRRAAALAGSEERLRVVHLGAEAPEPLPPRREERTVAVLGHLVPRKRHEDVLRALARLDGVRGLVIGDGPERARLEALAGELGVAVEWTGQLPPADALRQLATAHVMALPSEDEAFGVAYVEAMACGLPAIGLRGEGGPEEIAATGEGMLLVPARDPEALAVTIRHALGDQALAEAARQTARAKFSWAECGRATLEAYEEALRS